MAQNCVEGENMRFTRCELMWSVVLPGSVVFRIVKNRLVRIINSILLVIAYKRFPPSRYVILYK